ncbi:hypothetical protein UG55_102020 [Frankia sp. EI5c]|nr:hypothetical protein UG55_102020 [Frankia sp. EI5c]
MPEIGILSIRSRWNRGAGLLAGQVLRPGLAAGLPTSVAGLPTSAARGGAAVAGEARPIHAASTFSDCQRRRQAAARVNSRTRGGPAGFAKGA